MRERKKSSVAGLANITAELPEISPIGYQTGSPASPASPGKPAFMRLLVFLQSRQSRVNFSLYEMHS